MQLCKVQLETGEVRIAIVEHDHLQILASSSLTEVLHAERPASVIHMLVDEEAPRVSLHNVTLMAPVDRQEIWAAGVTYIRSREAREQESEGAAQFYNKVYEADRPELFFKAPAYRVVPPGGRARIRRDSKWSVPEPEVALVISPEMKIVGYTIGNDMSSRDIEGENPLYLPQAKMYDGSCAVGPSITLAEAMPERETVRIRMAIERKGSTVFEGETSLKSMARSFEDLVSWLGRETTFPRGAILLTGTGIVPPDDFTLEVDDRILIDVDGIGQLVNLVDQKE